MMKTLSLALLLLGCADLTPHGRRMRELEAALDAGDLETAERLGQEALEATPERLKVEKERGEVYYMLARVSRARGDLPEAVKLLGESTRLSAELEPAYALLADIQRELGLHDEAIRSYEHTVRLDPENGAYRVALCHTYLELYQQDAARGACAEALRLAPADPLARAGALLSGARDGEVEGAEAELRAIDGLDDAQREALSRALRVTLLEGPGRGRLGRIDQIAAEALPASRAGAPTLVRHGRAPGADRETPALKGAEALLYPAEPGAMRAWLRLPSGEGPHPAVLYLHRGFSVTQADVDATDPLVEAGYVVLLPTVRGEAGNPGEHEFLWGEVADAQAALGWLQRRAEVDPARVFVFGDAEGGALAGLAGLGAAAIGSYGALLTEQELVRYDLPFDLGLVDARRARLWTHQLAVLTRAPHLAWVSARDDQAVYAEELRADAIAAGAQLTIRLIPGDPALARDEAIRAFLVEIGTRPSLQAEVPSPPALH